MAAVALSHTFARRVVGAILAALLGMVVLSVGSTPAAAWSGGTGEIWGYFFDSNGDWLEGRQCPAQVTIYDASGNVAASEEVYTCGWYGNSDGYYELADGTYFLNVQLRSGSGYAEWWYGGDSLETATPIVISGGASVRVDTAFTKTSAIAASVLDSDGLYPTNKGWMTVTDSLGNKVASQDHSTWCADCGNTFVIGVDPGDYYVYFSHFGGDSPEWYNDASTRASATLVTVAAGEWSRADVALAASGGSTINGTVTMPGGGSPGTYGTIRAYNSDGLEVSSGTVYPSGSYILNGFGTGNYFLKVSGVAGAGATWFDGATTFGSADPVAMTYGANVVRNIQLVEQSTISGTVTISGGSTTAYGSVYAYDASGTYLGYDYVWPGDDGHYSIGSLGVGEYYLAFSSFDGAVENWWFNGASSLETATPVSVTAAGQNVVVDAALTAESTISGTVTVAGLDSSANCGGIYVDRPHLGETLVGSAVAEWNGSACTYTVHGLSAGDYIVQFTSFANGAANAEYFGDTESWVDATVITLAAGGSAVADAELTLGAHLSGHVTDAGTGVPVEGAYVGLRHAADILKWWQTRVYTDEAGFFIYPNPDVPAANYTLASGTVYYGGGRTLAEATWFPLQRGETLEGLDLELLPGGTISGSVTKAGGTGGSGVNVMAWLASDPSVTYSTYDLGTGEYSLPGLVPGDYVVAFKVNGVPNTYAPQYWDGASTSGDATLITVTDGGSVPGIDVELAPGAVVSGRVTDANAPGVGLPSVDVYLRDADGFSFGANWGVNVPGSTPREPGIPPWDGNGSVPSATTDADGYYTVPYGTPPGDYTLEFRGSPDGESAAYMPAFWGGANSLADADVLTIAGTSPVTADATLSLGGSISGTITHDGDSYPYSLYAPIAIAYSYDVDTDSWVQSGVGATIEDEGAYTIPGLAPGDYKVGFHQRPSNSGFGYLPDFWVAGTPTVWYDNQPDLASAALVTVTGTDDTPGIDATLATGGGPYLPTGIEVTVTVAGGAPATGGCVSAQNTSVIGYYVTCASVGGVFSLTDLPPGEYSVYLYDFANGVSEWYDGAETSWDATSVTVAVGEVTEIAAELAPAGSVSGTVTRDGGQPLTSGWVNVLSPSRDYLGQAGLDPSGDYLISGLPAGEVVVEFLGGDHEIPEFYDDAASLDDATPVVIDAGLTTTGVDADLAAGGAISGTLTSEAGGPATGGDVWAYDVATRAAYYGGVNYDGTYTVPALPAGDYRVEFANFDDVVGEFYDDAPDYESATDVTVAVDATTSGIDATLAVGGSISGTVTIEGGAPATNGWVDVYDSSASGEYIADDSVGSDGTYSVTGLAPGTYYLHFSSFDNGAPEWYDDATSLATATPVIVVAGATATVDVELAPGGVIAGTVTVAGEAPGTGGYVEVCDSSGDCGSGDSVNPDGSYSVGGLASGTYYLHFSSFENAVSEWYEDAASLATATPVTVVGGATTTIDAELALGGSIAGTVTVAGGAPATNGWVDVYDASENSVGYDHVGADGVYAVAGLAPGSYYVAFSSFDNGVSEWYDNATSFATATPVSVTAGVTNTISAELAAPSSISGTVTLPSGGVMDGLVWAIDAEGNWDGGTTPDPDGTYTISSLAAGAYSVHFGYFTGAANEFFDDAVDEASATPVVVGLGEDVFGIDASLAAEAVVTGAFVLPSSFSSGSACVGIFAAADDEFPIGSACGTAGESFEISWLPAGSFYVRFLDTPNPWSSGGWAGFTGEDAWYDGVYSFAEATPIALTPGATVELTIAWPTSVAPSVSNVSPATGPVAGGTTVTLTGSAFTGATGVTFDGVAGTALSVGSATSLTVVSPTHAAGPVDVVVTTSYGSSSARTFTYVAPPAITDVSPSSGAVAGGITVTLTGSAFTGATSVTFGGAAGTSLSVSSATSLTVTAPAHAAGAVNVVVSTPYGSSSAATFTYVAAPAVTTVSPSSGPTVGGTTVTLTGSALTGATSVTFGGLAGASLSVGSDSSLTVTSPAHAAGAVNVLVTTPYGVSTARTFTYVAAPAITNVSPTSGSTAGGTTVTLTGSAFTGATSVTFDGVSGTSLVVGSASSLTIVSPSHAAGAVDVVVTTPYGLSTAASFTYVAPPAVSNVSPLSGPVAGGTVVTLTGTAFTGATSVTFGGVAGTALSVGSATSLTVTSPAHASGVVSVVVTTPYGSSAPASFTYRALPVVASVSPGFGPTTGGTTVTVTGSGFTDASQVTFGGVAGTGLSVGSDTSLTVTTPAGSVVRAPIVVTNPVGGSAPAAAAFFAYTDGAVVAGIPEVIADVAGFTPNVVRCYQVTGKAGVPVGAVGVVLNVTASLPNAPGHVRVYPDYLNNGASPAPAVSTVNFEVARDVANSTTISLPTGGKVCAYGVGGTLARLILDVDGYILPGSGIELITPEKLVDTRPQAWYHAGSINGPVQPMTDYEVQVGGVGSVPSDAVAVIANITVVDTRSPGHLRMWASDTAMPNTSVVNYAPETKANSQIVALSADGKLTFRSFSYVPTSVSPVQVLIDVTGYIAAGSDFVATVPTKLIETRSAYGIVGPITGALNNGVIYPVPVDTSVVPAGATAVILNVTAVQPTAFGHIRVYPDTNGLGTTPPPVMSNLNFIPGRDIPNMVIVQLPADRKIDLYTVFSGGGRTDLVVNIIGYIAGPT